MESYQMEPTLTAACVARFTRSRSPKDLESLPRPNDVISKSFKDPTSHGHHTYNGVLLAEFEEYHAPNSPKIQVFGYMRDYKLFACVFRDGRFQQVGQLSKWLKRPGSTFMDAMSRYALDSDPESSLEHIALEISIVTVYFLISKGIESAFEFNRDRFFSILQNACCRQRKSLEKDGLASAEDRAARSLQSTHTSDELTKTPIAGLASVPGSIFGRPNRSRYTCNEASQASKKNESCQSGIALMKRQVVSPEAEVDNTDDSKIKDPDTTVGRLPSEKMHNDLEDMIMALETRFNSLSIKYEALRDDHRALQVNNDILAVDCEFLKQKLIALEDSDIALGESHIILQKSHSKLDQEIDEIVQFLKTQKTKLKLIEERQDTHRKTCDEKVQNLMKDSVGKEMLEGFQKACGVLYQIHKRHM